MKTWNIASAKFYSEMMNGLASFFGLNADETTEAEMHQQLIEAGSLSEIRAAALKEANEAVAAQMADFKTQLETLQTSFNDLKADAESKGEKVAELEQQLETVRGNEAAKDAAIAQHLEQIKSLSGEVATMKAGKPIDRQTPPDESKPVTSGGGASNGARVVSMQELEAALSN